jgi:hypothetical protein
LFHAIFRGGFLLEAVKKVGIGRVALSLKPHAGIRLARALPSALFSSRATYPYFFHSFLEAVKKVSEGEDFYNDNGKLLIMSDI